MKKEEREKKQAKRRKELKENALSVGAVAVGSLVGYAVGSLSALPMGALAILSTNKYLMAGSAAAMAGGILAGATEPTADTGEFAKDLAENAKVRGKGAVKGLARAFYVDKIAPQVMDTLSGNLGTVDNIDYGAAEEFIRQIEAKQADMYQQQGIPEATMEQEAVNGLEEYVPQSQMNGVSQYVPA